MNGHASVPVKLYLHHRQTSGLSPWAVVCRPLKYDTVQFYISLLRVITRAWEILVLYLMCRTMLPSLKRKPHFFRINQRNYVNRNGCLGDFYGLYGEENHYSVLELLCSG